MRRLISCLLFAQFAILSAMADRGGFYYKSWDVKATVSAKNVWTVNEVKRVYFNEPRHGIYRYIPECFYASLNIAEAGQPAFLSSKQYYVDLDITSANGAETETYTEDDNLVIRFGDEDVEITGDKTYSLAYTYTYPDDRINARDFLYHTLKPADVNENVETFSFDVSFEKPLPAVIAKRLKVFKGSQGSHTEADSIIDFVVTPTRISGKVKDMQPNEALTLYAELPSGYWEDTYVVNPLYGQIAAAIAALLALALILIELRQRELPSPKAIEFYAPDDVTPSEVGIIIDDSTDTIDITALVPWLAQRGYLRIKEVQVDGVIKKSTDIELTKLKDLPDSAPDYQKRIMELLFANDQDTQLMSKLGKHPTRVEKAIKALDNHFKGERKLKNKKYVWLVALVVLFSTLAIGFDSLVSLHDEGAWICAFFAWALPFTLAAALRIMLSTKDPFTSNLTKRLSFAGRLICFAGNLTLLLLLFEEESDTVIPTWALAGMAILCYFACELSGRLNQDTEYRASLRGRLQGFREFIDTAEKDRIKMLVDDNPEYFFDVLPYAMVFGLTDKWVKQFKDINIQRTEWYDATSATSYGYINGLTSGMNNSVNNAITTCAPSSSGSGGFGV